ncbi:MULTISPECIES: hypothetical protein [Streptococcus]|uniref:hypothetical protein n=1 Tax=Streptococcus TaxID=1301 RepID=UPI000277F64D|nr:MULTISPECIES: hypothetical protein [Streptococcus]EJO18847.1 hypothetical protein HMPREF1149_1548 [Streptococcus sp. BS35b]ETS88498.1 hypothetical protein HMPREF1513_0617 [Streptococcus sp. BS29a]EUB29528.1 hypothetical protein HMPREF1515_0422 [Streptococcus sp. BS21]MCY7105024.1 hypothetical protein [Streptococcus oralis]
MNGQMYQIACIVAAARKALKTDQAILYHPDQYINKICFQILPSKNGEATELSVSDWFEDLKEKGLKDLQLFCPISVEDRGILGFSNTTQSSILCFDKDGKASYFLPNWKSASPGRGWDVTYTEYEWERSSQDIPHYENNIEEFKDILTRIENLAIKIECDNFAKVFQSARNFLLDPESGKGLAEPQIPLQHLSILRAASSADVFGGMGSWNDEPGWLAQDKGLGQVYDELSDQLLRNIRSAILFAINEW